MKLSFNHISLSPHYGKLLKPSRDWYIILIVSAVALLASVAWHVWLFERVANGEVLGAAPMVTPSVFDQSSLTAIEKIFTDRTGEEAKYISGAYQFVDPSK